MKYPFYRQLDSKDCGPSCLRMIAKYYGRQISSREIRTLANQKRTGTSLLDISVAANAIGFDSVGMKVSWSQLKEMISLPCIVSWNQNHFVVVYEITNTKVIVGDPIQGIIKYKHEQFLKSWLSVFDDPDGFGIVLQIKPSPEFNNIHIPNSSKRIGFKSLVSYIAPYSKYLAIVFLLVVLGGFLSLLFPTLTRLNVDIGIDNRDLKFVLAILFGQFMLTIGQSAIEVVKNWLMVNVSVRVNLSLVSDYLGKLMRLPISFFDSKRTGDLLQRIGDFSRIQQFLTGILISVIMALVSFVVYSIIVSSYNIPVLLVFLLGSIIYIVWVLLFLKQRKKLDYMRFQESASNQSSIIQLISGMQEIKLDNCETKRQQEWEGIQAKLYDITLRGLNLSQIQNIGGMFIDQSKNILITFLSAKAVIDGDMSFGIMLALQYVVGQMNAPVAQFVSFIQSAQDAQISLERLNEIHEIEDEERADYLYSTESISAESIIINNLSFQYNGPRSPYVLRNISLIIPHNKVTAIVGASGSGKTTLLKLILGFYPPTEGTIYIGGTELMDIKPSTWRSQCGVVMQDGFIFSDTIANNIASGPDECDIDRVYYAAQQANIHNFILSLPMGYNTIIGAEGNGLSAGQKQRILIARALYKNAKFLLFDEATNALDAENEYIIMNNLYAIFHDRTVVVIAHRLSTVKNADNIVVLNNGEIIEQGNHEQLIHKHGAYYQLVEDQLNLGE